MTDLATKLEQLEALSEKWRNVRCSHPQDGGCTCESRAESCADELDAFRTELKELVGRARLEEAKWWHLEAEELGALSREMDRRIAELEAAIGKGAK